MSGDIGTKHLFNWIVQLCRFWLCIVSLLASLPGHSWTWPHTGAIEGNDLTGESINVLFCALEGPPPLFFPSNPPLMDGCFVWNWWYFQECGVITLVIINHKLLIFLCAVCTKNIESWLVIVRQCLQSYVLYVVRFLKCLPSSKRYARLGWSC